MKPRPRWKAILATTIMTATTSPHRYSPSQTMSTTPSPVVQTPPLRNTIPASPDILFTTSAQPLTTLTPTQFTSTQHPTMRVTKNISPSGPNALHQHRPSQTQIRPPTSTTPKSSNGPAAKCRGTSGANNRSPSAGYPTRSTDLPSFTARCPTETTCASPIPHPPTLWTAPTACSATYKAISHGPHTWTPYPPSLAATTSTATQPQRHPHRNNPTTRTIPYQPTLQPQLFRRVRTTQHQHPPTLKPITKR
jgi:hypothetical protein